MSFQSVRINLKFAQWLGQETGHNGGQETGHNQAPNVKKSMLTTALIRLWVYCASATVSIEPRK